MGAICGAAGFEVSVVAGVDADADVCAPPNNPPAADVEAGALFAAGVAEVVVATEVPNVGLDAPEADGSDFAAPNSEVGAVDCAAGAAVDVVFEVAGVPKRLAAGALALAVEFAVMPVGGEKRLPVGFWA